MALLTVYLECPEPQLFIQISLKGKFSRYVCEVDMGNRPFAPFGYSVIVDQCFPLFKYLPIICKNCHWMLYPIRCWNTGWWYDWSSDYILQFGQGKHISPPEVKLSELCHVIFTKTSLTLAYYVKQTGSTQNSHFS